MTKLVVFDMGGVLFEFQGDRLIAETSQRARRWRSDEVQKRWIPLAREFETGVVTEGEFAEAVVRTYELELTASGFLVAFRDAAVGYYAGAVDLVREIAVQHRVISLSNTNPVQWPAVLAGLGERDPFFAHHPSHLSGFHKPDPRAFAALHELYGKALEFYFFDDRADNVAAARAAGFHARRTRGVLEARTACVEFGLFA
ncbi:MAG TPA: HAD-IA family hydrolase [Polyangiaceae bacterium]